MSRACQTFLKRPALSLALSVLIVLSAVAVLRSAVVRSPGVEPIVSSVSGTANDGGTITVSAASSGTKIAAAPLNRHDSSSAANGDLPINEDWCGGWPSDESSVSSINAFAKLQDHSVGHPSVHKAHSATANATMQGTQPPPFTTHHDTIPNFAQNPTIVSATNGNWSSASTWDLGRVPSASDVALVNHAVTYDSTTGNADVIGIAAGGALRFRTDINTLLQVGVLLVQPSGILEVGTASQPLSSSVKAEVVIRNRSLSLSPDPDQYGTGLISIDGIVTMHGAVRIPTFVRTAAEPRAGNNSITLEQSVTGWQVGDRIFLPDTRQVHPDNWFNPNYALQIEERTVQNISADGRTITLSSALSFDHRGAHDADGASTVLSNGIKLLPHVGNLTRNIIIRSEDPSGTRGHTLFTHRSNANISYVQFQDLGRTRAEPLSRSTNHIGRYPLHAHHLWGPTNPTNTGHQFKFVGNAINDSLKWPIAIHGSHYGLIKHNVVFGGSQLTGAGIAVEDSTETENLFEENFVANIRGDINARNSGPGTEDGSTPGSAAECYWSHGFNNRFVNNVASDCRNASQQVATGPGWKFIVQAAPYTERNPLFRGADMTNASQTVAVTPQFQPILEFRGNEVYGGSSVGFTAWTLGTDGYDVPTGIQETLIKDFRVWNVYESAIWNYPTQRVTIDGLTSRADPAITLFMPGAFVCGDYRNIDVTIRGGSIHGGSVFGGCIDPLGTFRFENIDAVTRGHAFSFETPATPGTGADRPPSGVTMTLRNNTIRAWPGQPLRTIEMFHNTTRGNDQPGDNYDVLVYNYQGQPGNNFQAYFSVQATQNLYGGLSPCNDNTTRPEVDGITCNGSAPPADTTPPSTPTGLNATAVSSSQITLSWTGSTDDVGVTEYRVERCQGAGCTAFTQIATPSSAAYSDTGLTAGATYRYQVRAADAAGNLSGWSSIVNGTTLAPSATLQFSATSYSVGEDCTSHSITVTRVGDTSGAATVNYATANGTASDRADFTSAQGTLRFAPGESIKTFAALITQDSRSEGTEMATITLSNPTGANLGVPSTVTLEILDDVSEPGGNVIDDPGMFVCHQYHDFLNRQADAAGLAFWINEITQCGSDQACIELKRINVSAAFFLSIEFQETGYLAYRMYKAAYGDTTSPNVAIPVPIIRLQEFLPDAGAIGQGVQVGVGNWQAQLEANKNAFAREFVLRPRFLGAYPLTMTATEFVNKLDLNAGGVLSQAERNQLIAELTAAPDVTAGRASVTRKVAEDADLRQRETNRAFVLMQYYGYLRRNPDDAPDTDFRGWEFWLNKLNQFNGNFINAEMVKAFIVSIEYRQRFGP